jgi:hypothetical protein
MKWNGFFMPESIKTLKNLWKDDNKTPRPQAIEALLDELEKNSK